MATQWLTVREAAAILKKHPETIRECIRRGLLPDRRLGGRGNYRLRPEDLDAAMVPQEKPKKQVAFSTYKIGLAKSCFAKEQKG